MKDCMYKYDAIFKFKNGFAKVYKDKLYGIIDINYKEVIPIEYEDIADITNSIFLVKKDGKIGLIRNDGSILLEPNITP